MDISMKRRHFAKWDKTCSPLFPLFSLGSMFSPALVDDFWGQVSLRPHGVAPAVYFSWVSKALAAVRAHANQFCADRLAGGASEWQVWGGYKCRPGFKGGICCGNSLALSLQSRTEDWALFSSSDLKRTAEFCSAEWNFPLVGVHTNLAISGYLHMLV